MPRKYADLTIAEKKTRWVMVNVENRNQAWIMHLIGDICLVGGGADYVYDTVSRHTDLKLDFVQPPMKTYYDKDGTVQPTVYENKAKTVVGHHKQLTQREAMLEAKEHYLRVKEAYSKTKEAELTKKEE